MRTAPVRAGSIGATPAFHGQRGLDGEPVANRYRPKTIANRQTDRPGIRRRGICRCGANPRREDRFLQADRPADRHARPRPPRRPCHGLRPGRAPLPPRGQQRRAHRPRLAAATGIARKGRRSLQGQRLRRRRPLHVGGNPITRIAPAPRPEPASGAATGRAPGTPPGRAFAPPPDTIARQAAATYRRKKFGIPHQNRYLRITPHTLRAYCGGQYSPPGMRLSGKSTA